MRKQQISAEDVLRILTIFKEVGASVWIAGGWAVDALVGKQLVPNGEPFLYPQNALTTGRINNETVPCLTAKQLVTFHLGYKPLDKDRHNMRMLNRYLNISLPEGYQK